MKRIDFSNGFEVQKYFDGVLKSMQGVKIISVFACYPSFSNCNGLRVYNEDTEIYILFENDICLVIDYRFVDALEVALRPLSDEEKLWYQNATMKDFFNDSTNIYTLASDNQTTLDRCQRISLEYGSLKSIVLEYVTRPYSKWVAGSLVDEVAPKETTSDKITFSMENGKSFVICPDDAMVDGYTLVWSADAKETVTICKGQ